jgi:hypothetical protein
MAKHFSKEIEQQGVIIDDQDRTLLGQGIGHEGGNLGLLLTTPL